MRTTVTLDADTEQMVRERMERRGVSFKRALNDAIRESGARHRPEPYQTRTSALGVPTVNLDRALALVGDLEDDELIRRMRSGS